MTEPTDETQEDGPLQNWFLLIDPAWTPTRENDAPPPEVVVGLWPMEEDGKLGKFRPNPDYVPSDDNSPSDPLDAVLRLVVQGRAQAEHIQLMLRDSQFNMALNGDGRPLIIKSPDDVPCVVVATGQPHVRRMGSLDWRAVELDELVVALADGVDVLFNPGGAASVRLTGDFMRETLMMDEERAAELYASHNEDSDVQFVPWSPEAESDGGDEKTAG